MKTMQELSYWLALLRAPGIGPAHFMRLLNLFPTLSQLFQQDRATYQQMHLPSEMVDYLLNPTWQKVALDLQWQQSAESHHIVTLKCHNYPTLLKELSHPPPLLFVKGDISLLNTTQIAMVGSRKPSPEGKEIAYRFASELSQAGITVTSGLAMGVDACAHEGALKYHHTLAVIGTGINIVYPKSNHSLFKQIAEHGAIISEFPIDTPPLASNFPRRNRIISGLTLGTLVIEASLKSGSLITARCALEQGREVFAIPGSIRNPNSQGCHALLKQGAKLVETIEDIFEELLIFTHYPISLAQKPALSEQKRLDDGHLKLLECIGYEPTKIDILVERSHFSVPIVTSILIDLELAGYISNTVSGYSRVSA